MKVSELIKALRTTKSRSKRTLLNEAADTIEALLSDLKKSAHADPCGMCLHGGIVCAVEGFDCPDCTAQGCPCRACVQEKDGWV